MEKFLCLKASAGSGKTFALTVRYISLLLQDVNVTSILTLTFTNKAALEMSTRIYETILDLGNDKSILEAISLQTNLSIDEILNKKDEILNNITVNELSIFTIDKFVNKILREFAGYINIDDDFSISNDDEDLMLYKFLNSLDSKEFESLIYFSHSYNKKLSSIIELFKVLDEKNEQYEVVDFNLEILNVLKTEILTNAQKIKEYVLQSKLSPSAKKAVDFNDIKTLLDKGKTWLSKDSLGEFTYFKKDKQIIELDDNFHKIKENLKYYYKLEEQKILNNLFNIFNNFKKFRLDYKKQKNSFEFRDITNLVYDLLSKYIDKEFLYFRLDTRYNHMLVDEFQDTSVLQYKILEPLIDEIILNNSDIYKTFFYVGDTKQSIYRFRGGNKDLFDYVIDKYSPNLKLQILDTNYRSSKSVVNFVNNIFQNVPAYEYYAQKVNSKTVGKVEITSLYLEDTYKFIDIKTMLEKLLEEGINPKNIAILTYTNKDVIELYEYLTQEFKKLKIITEVTSKLINQKNIKAAVNLIKYYYFKKDIYKANFNALIGNDVNLEIELILDIKTNKLENIVKQIAYYYNLLDENYIKFIEILGTYNNIVEFIFEIDNLEESMVNKDNIGLQILTVFKSKGLEFDTVMVLDRISKKNADKSSLLFSYQDINLNKIFYKNKNRENFDDDYNNAIQSEKELSLNDERNILYVALTRAKNNMIIFKKQKDSVFDNLNVDFSNQSIGELYINKSSKSDEIINKDINYIPLNLGIQEITTDKKVQSKDSIKAKYFGIATHYCLEMMKNFDKKSLEFSFKIMKSKYNTYLDELDFKDIKNRINILINNNQFKNIISNNEYFKEQSLIYNDELKIVDLLVKDDNKYIVIDYKTTKEKLPSHNTQVNFYKKAISNITNCSYILGYVVYLKEDNIEFVEVK